MNWKWRHLKFILPIFASIILIVYTVYMNTYIELPLNQSVKEQGVIVLAHGGSPQWDNDVLRASKKLAERYPTVVAFGMADTESIQRAVDTLEHLAVKKIVAIPLFISSHSEFYRQTQYVLGIRENPDADFIEGMQRAMAHPLKFIWNKISWENIPYALSMMKHHRWMTYNEKVSHRVPITLLPAFDGSKLIGEILEQRALNLSQNPAHEAVLIVAHGPIRDDDDSHWLAYMETLAVAVRGHSFHNVCVATMRDDAPAEIKNKAIARMRDIVQKCVEKGDRVIVIPLLLARGGVEGEIRHLLKGLPYVYDEQTLLPHANIDRWLLESAEIMAVEYPTNYILHQFPSALSTTFSHASHSNVKH